MSNLQAVSIHDTQPIHIIDRTQLKPQPQNASGREAQTTRWVTPLQPFASYAGVEAMRQFAERMRKLP